MHRFTYIACLLCKAFLRLESLSCLQVMWSPTTISPGSGDPRLHRMWPSSRFENHPVVSRLSLFGFTCAFWSRLQFLKSQCLARSKSNFLQPSIKLHRRNLTTMTYTLHPELKGTDTPKDYHRIHFDPVDVPAKRIVGLLACQRESLPGTTLPRHISWSERANTRRSGTSIASNQNRLGSQSPDRPSPSCERSSQTEERE